MQLHIDNGCKERHEAMNEYYFTYGTDSAFPFCGGYTKVIAKTIQDAINLFSERHPCRHKGIVNCAFIYFKEEFKLLFDGKNLECHEVIC